MVLILIRVTISAKDMAENLGIDSVMTDFEWDEDINRGLILTGES